MTSEAEDEPETRDVAPHTGDDEVDRVANGGLAEAVARALPSHVAVHAAYRAFAGRWLVQVDPRRPVDLAERLQLTEEAARAAARYGAEAVVAVGPGYAPGQRPGHAPGQRPGQVAGHAPGQVAGHAPGQRPGQVAGHAPGQVELALGVAPGHAQGARRLLLEVLPGYRQMFGVLDETTRYPQHLALGVLAEMAGHVLALLAATRGVALRAEAPFESFAEAFAGNATFGERDVALWQHLRGLAAVRLEAEWEGQGRWSAAFHAERRAALEALEGLLDRAERWARDAMATPLEQVRRRRARLAGWVGVGAALLVLLVWALWPPPALEPVDEAALGTPGGIVGVYFDGTEPDEGPEVGRRVDRRISFTSRRKIHPKLKDDEFSVRWEGFLRFSEAGEVAVCTENDDGARLWLGGELLVDDWARHGTTTTCGTARVEAGWYPLKVEFFDFVSNANIKLKVGKDKNSAKLVEPADLCCKD